MHIILILCLSFFIESASFKFLDNVTNFVAFSIKFVTSAILPILSHKPHWTYAIFNSAKVLKFESKQQSGDHKFNYDVIYVARDINILSFAFFWLYKGKNLYKARRTQNFKSGDQLTIRLLASHKHLTLPKRNLIKKRKYMSKTFAPH